MFRLKSMFDAPTAGGATVAFTFISIRGRGLTDGLCVHRRN